MLLQGLRSLHSFAVLSFELELFTFLFYYEDKLVLYSSRQLNKNTRLRANHDKTFTMHFKSSVLLLAAAGFAAQVSAVAIGPSGALDLDTINYRDLRLARRQNRNGGGGRNNNDNNNNNDGGNGGSQTCLAANAIQTGSAQTGQGDVVTDGQKESAT